MPTVSEAASVPVTEPRVAKAPARRGAPRRALVAVLAAAALGLSACGGGYVDGSVWIDVVVSGQVVDGWSAPVGSAQTVSIRVGQSVQLDAGEPVVWTLQAGGVAFPGGSGTIDYGGVYITRTALSPSRLVVDTASPYRIAATVPVRFTAVSTYDGALITMVDVYIGG